MFSCHRTYNGGMLIVTDISSLDPAYLKLINRYMDVLNRKGIIGTVKVNLVELIRIFDAPLSSTA
ncbi:hypothetical protein [Marinicrinis lubricantis]|uniref:Uncharacterized protein n=1 Tax=Marinicrinis lubricantis TaxID=2086470 RepID=A0ABW1INA5_9BACL